MRGKRIIHKDGSESIIIGDLEVIKNKEELKDQKDIIVVVDKIEKVKVKGKKMSLKSIK